MKQSCFFTVVLLFCFAITINTAQAHGSGVSYEETKDGFLIDIGHDEFIAAGESTRLDFALYPEDISQVEGEVFTDVWVTITKDKVISFAGGVHKPEIGVTGFSIVLPQEGEYLVSARFQKEGETVVKTEFPLTVIPSVEEASKPPEYLLYVLSMLAGMFLGMVIGLFIPRKKNI